MSERSGSSAGAERISRIIFKVCGVVIGSASLAAVLFASAAFAAGQLVGGAVTIAVAALFGWMARYCLSKKRRAADLSFEP